MWKREPTWLESVQDYTVQSVKLHAGAVESGGFADSSLMWQCTTKTKTVSSEADCCNFDSESEIVTWVTG